MSSPVCLCGIDPGLTGALAYLFPEMPDKIAVEDMPVAGGDIDPATLAQRLRTMMPTAVMIERVASRPGQGVASVFKFGKGYGTVLGVVAAIGIPIHFVTPGKWKKHFGLPADKDASRTRALQLWPSSAHFSRKKDHNRGEAALLARYAAETLK